MSKMNVVFQKHGPDLNFKLCAMPNFVVEPMDKYKDPKDLSNSLKEKYELVLEFKNENELEQAFTKFTKENYICRTLIL